VDLVTQLVRDTWPLLRCSIVLLSSETGFHESERLESLKEQLVLLNGINTTLRLFQPEIFQQDLEALKIALSPAKHWSSRFRAWLLKPQLQISAEYRCTWT
jgi:hypothetical protein